MSERSSECEASVRSISVSTPKGDSIPAAGAKLSFTYFLRAAAKAEYRRVILLGEEFERCGRFEGVNVILLGEFLAQRPP